MKILFVGSRKSNHSKKWVNSLVEKGHDVLLVCQHEDYDKSVEFDDRVKIHMLKYGGYKSYILNVPEMRKVYDNYKPDVVNVHYMSGYGLMATLARLRPLVLNCYGSDIFVAPKRNKVLRWIVKFLLKRADAVAATSKAMAAEAKLIMGSNQYEVTVTPFGVDVNQFKKDEERRYNDRPVIGIIKYLKPEYNIPLLIKAFAITCKRVSIKPLLHIYGSGPLKEEFVQAIMDGFSGDNSDDPYESLSDGYRIALEQSMNKYDSKYKIINYAGIFNEQVISTATVLYKGNKAIVYNITTNKMFQKQGVCKQMMTEIIEDLNRIGIEIVCLQTEQGFYTEQVYKNMGFQEVMIGRAYVSKERY